MTWVHLKVYMHLGGSVATYPTLSYVGGKVMECDLDPDMLCYYTLWDMVKEASYRAVKHFPYCEPRLQFNEGLRVCYDDSSVIAMINHLRNLRSLHIYVEHTVDIAEDLTLVSSIKDVTRDVTTEVWTTNEQESVGHDVKATASSPVVPASSTPSIILGPTTHVATEAITQAHETTPQAQLHQDQGLFTEYRASSTPIVPSYSTPYVAVTPTTNQEHSVAPKQIAPFVKSTSSTNQLLMRLSTRGKQIVNGLGLYTDERTGMQILNPGLRGKTVITLPKGQAKKRKESNNSDVFPIRQESIDTKQTKYKPSS
ncbi:hypothetical protein V6N11_044205 [Hibiscus sabdariffa]|uniref:PB1-like domain-containing protein n=1 Tax=Hibiscus sabdariffa TaxID=183260 RepID=A0ABR2REI1_9ROSI